MIDSKVNNKADDCAAHTAIYKNRIDVNALELSDFHKTCYMHFVLDFYSRLLELVDEYFSIQFPIWSSCSWGMAWHLRGPENLLIDTLDDKEWVIDFLDYLTCVRKHWEKGRANFLNSNIPLGNVYNDEVLSPMISPGLYKKIIRPTEIELSKFYGGINYWHSCGNTTPFQDLIDEIPDIRMVNITPWSDMANAIKKYNNEN